MVLCLIEMHRNEFLRILKRILNLWLISCVDLYLKRRVAKRVVSLDGL